MDGWDYGPGNVNDSDSWFGVQYPEYTSSGSTDFSSGAFNLFGGLLNTYASTWQQKTLMQQNQEGQQYLEGQRILMANQQAAALAASKAGGFSQILLIGGLIAVVMMLKD